MPTNLSSREQADLEEGSPDMCGRAGTCTFVCAKQANVCGTQHMCREVTGLG